MKEIRAKWREPVAHVIDGCASQSHVNPSAIEAFFENGAMPHNPAWKCFLRCAAFELQVLNSTGVVNVQKWSDTFEHLELPLAQQCANQVKETDLCELAFQLLDCVHDDLGKKHPAE